MYCIGSGVKGVNCGGLVVLYCEWGKVCEPGLVLMYCIGSGVKGVNRGNGFILFEWGKGVN
jgi:hypothetical protein